MNQIQVFIVAAGLPLWLLSLLLLYHYFPGNYVYFVMIVSAFIVSYIMVAFAENNKNDRFNDIQKICQTYKITYEDRLRELPVLGRYNFEKIGPTGYQAVMKGRFCGVSFVLADYVVIVPTPNGASKVLRGTVCCLSKTGIKVPDFYLCHEKVENIGYINKMLKNDINFKEDPEFSKTFWLKGKDEESIRLLFDRNVREIFKKNCIYACSSYEIIESTFTVAVLGDVMNGKERLSFLYNCTEIYERLVDSVERNYIDVSEVEESKENYNFIVM